MIFDLVRKLGVDAQARALEGRPGPVNALLRACKALKVALALASLLDALVSAVLGEVRASFICAMADAVVPQVQVLHGSTVGLGAVRVDDCVGLQVLRGKALPLWHRQGRRSRKTAGPHRRQAVCKSVLLQHQGRTLSSHLEADEGLP